MSLTVNTNILSLTAQNNLNQSQKSLNTAIERLSSGSKINSAKDDAAGQAIANRLTSQIRGLNQASSNANDGISLAQTTEGALNQVNDNLQRIRQLSVQAANGTNSSSDLQSIQKEISQRLAEINRVSQQTAFNGTKVLDGSKSSISIQVGSQDGQTISINLQSVDSNSLNLGRFSVSGGGQSVSAKITSNVTTFPAVTTANATTAGVATTLVSYKDSAGSTQYAVQTATTPDTTTGGPVTYSFAKANIDQGGNITAGGSVTVDPTTAKNVADGATVTSNGVTLDTTGVASGSSVVSYADANGTTQYAIQSGASGSYTYTQADISDQGVVSDSGTKVNLGGATTTAVANGDFAANGKTTDPLAALDAAIKTVDSLRSDLGAVQNRLDSAITNISSTNVNLSSARSRIQDANYASEVSKLSKAQILQQAGTSVLAKANQSNQGVLSLLR
jgi:flagellin